MVDFRKRLAKKGSKNLIDPLAIYETLDRASDKGPLRPAQSAVLKDWHEQYSDQQDVILKLHTGQGKTLIGLLILQSKLNEDGGPVVYLCPNKFLINQTCEQAKQFGIAYCTAEDDLPSDFFDGKSILITTVHKLFNGLTKFGIGTKSTKVSSVVLDDAHACIDAIRDSFLIRLARKHPAYQKIRDLFSNALENQGMGTYADIYNGNHDVQLPVPYWEWRNRHAEVVNILSRDKNTDDIKFAWPIIKDQLVDCQCVVSGGALEIAPYLPPLHLFGSYYKANHRVFMSATFIDDSFLVKGLGLSPETIRHPLVYKKERWSGEKMMLIPSLLHETLDRSAIVETFGKENNRKKFGVVVLAPSFKGTTDWSAYGSTVAKRHTIDGEIENLRNGNYEKTLVVVNRYDGIDLPDNTCRLLIFDSKPYSESLIDRYAENCRSTSEVIAIRTARTIEQGLGRSVRGEKDYCVIILTGPELIKSIRSKQSRQHLSSQTEIQIEIGLEIADMSREEIESGLEPMAALKNLILQCLRRDPDWKAFYVEQMDRVGPSQATGMVLELLQGELEAEKKFQEGDHDAAVQSIQDLIDKYIADDAEKGWYLQEMARYLYPQSQAESNKKQMHAHIKNSFLLKPMTGMQIAKINVISQKRMENIINWIQGCGNNFEDLYIAIESILSSLTFGVKADRFEEAFNDLAKALGFDGQRPDKEWKEGPDNLWALRSGEYFVVECKNGVALTRSKINKGETEQMNRSCAWFDKHYDGAKATNIIIHPSNKLESAAALTHDVKIMRKKGLDNLTANVRSFYAEFRSMDFRDLSEKRIQQLVDTHNLSVETIIMNYTTHIRS